MNASRRDFLMTAGGVAAAGLVFSASNRAEAQAAAPAPGEHVLPPLPYAYDALEPYLDARTMELHHSKHHAAYVKGLNAAESALAKARAENDFSLIQHWSRQASFHGGGHYLHSLFWKVMAPAGKGGGGQPTGQLLEKITADFGSFDSFKAQFSAAAAAVEGGGWALLHYRPEDQKLLVLQAENQHKLASWNSVPILGIDVWEHAYYLKYQNNRTDYIKAWWEVVNWDQVAKNLVVHHQ